MIITKQDIADVTGNFTVNIEDRLINPKIKDAQVFDLGFLLGASLTETVVGYGEIPAAWNVETVYQPGASVIQGFEVYDAMQTSTGVVPVAGNVNWQYSASGTLRYFHLKEFLCWSAYRRFLLTHGRNVTQNGLTNPIDPQATFQPLSDKARAELVADAESKANYYAEKVRYFLRENNLTETGHCGHRGRSNSCLRIFGI